MRKGPGATEGILCREDVLGKMPKPERLDVFEMYVNKQYGLTGWLLSTWKTRRWPVTGYGEGFEGFKDSFCSPQELSPGSRAGMEGCG